MIFDVAKIFSRKPCGQSCHGNILPLDDKAKYGNITLSNDKVVGSSDLFWEYCLFLLGNCGCDRLHRC